MTNKKLNTKQIQKGNAKSFSNSQVAKNIRQKEIEPSNQVAGKKYNYNLVYIGIILLVGLLIYARSIGFDFTYADDDWLIKDNLAYNTNWSNFISCFSRILGTTYYRPILNITFLIDAQIAGPNIWMYHVTNLLLHLIGCVLVFVALYKMGYGRNIALFFALLFASHPILTPAAVWISGRNDSLLTVFILLSLITLINYYEKKKGATLYLILHILSYSLAIFSKEPAVFFPFVATIYILLIIKEKISSKKNIYIGLSWFVVTLIWFILRQKALVGALEMDNVGISALMANAPAFFAIIGKIFLPVKMNALSVFESLSIITGVIFLIALILFVFITKKSNKKAILFGAMWFCISLLPSLMVRLLYVDDFFDYAEHRAYLPLFGLFVILIELLKAYNIDFTKKKQMFIGGGLILIFAVRTVLYSGSFTDRFTFWDYFVKMYPNKSRGYYYLGKYYIDHDKIPKAEEVFLKGISLNTKSNKMYIDLATIFVRKENFVKAGFYAMKSLEVDSLEPTSNFYVGKARNETKNYLEAIPYLIKALKNKPDAPSHWHTELGISYYESGQSRLAVPEYLKAISLDPNASLAYSNLGAAYADIGENQKAEEMLLKALTFNKDDMDQRFNLMLFYINTHNFSKAREAALYLKSKGAQLPAQIAQLLGV